MGHILLEELMEGKKLSDTNPFDDLASDGGAYWNDGKNVNFLYSKIEGADVDSFLQYAGPWATDKNYCYWTYLRLQNADRETFTVLNRTFAKDKFNLWRDDGKKMKGLDAESFKIFGDEYSVTPCGFCKDKNHVYYYFSLMEIKIVRNALPETFISLNREFGHDGNNVFWHEKRIKKADIETFEVIKGVDINNEMIPYAKDKNKYYFCNKTISKNEFEKGAKKIERFL
jgi:hypothetical protein